MGQHAKRRRLGPWQLPAATRLLHRIRRRSPQKQRDVDVLRGLEPMAMEDQQWLDSCADEYDDVHSCAGCGLTIWWSPGGMMRLVEPTADRWERHNEGLCSGDAAQAERERRWHERDDTDCWRFGFFRDWDTPEDEQAKALIAKATWVNERFERSS